MTFHDLLKTREHFRSLAGAKPPVKLLDGAWLLARAEAIRAAPDREARRSFALARRQDLERDEPNAFMEPSTLDNLPRGRDEGGAALPLICVSHAWHGMPSPQISPDPPRSPQISRPPDLPSFHGLP